VIQSTTIFVLFSTKYPLLQSSNQKHTCQYLYSQGARTFWIHNTGPIGCLPVALPIHNAYNYTPADGYLDQNGCVVYQNDMAKEFNTKLNDTVVKLRALYLDASFVYVDIFSAKYELIGNAKKEGKPFCHTKFYYQN